MVHGFGRPAARAASVLILSALAACATPQTDRLLDDPAALPPRAEVAGVPFFPQEDYWCGPAALAMPLAWAVLPDPSYISVCFGAVLGGAVFGDQCSPISDTTILSALACGGDIMDHVTTQLPLALTAASLAAVASTILAVVAL